MRDYRTWMRMGVIAALVAVTGGPGTAVLPARAEIPPHLGYGVNVRFQSHVDSLFAPLGFG